MAVTREVTAQALRRRDDAKMAARVGVIFFKEMRLMDSTMIDSHLENIDRRLTRVEHILPTLATKGDLTILATKDDLTTLATKEELRLAVAQLATKEDLATLATNVGTLATKEELRAGLLEEGERSRRYMDVIAESLRSDIQLLAGHLASEMSKRLGP